MYREHRDDSRRAGLLFWPRGPVLSCHWVEIWMLSLDCLHSSPTLYLLFSHCQYYYFNQIISITKSQLIMNHSFCTRHCFIFIFSKSMTLNPYLFNLIAVLKKHLRSFVCFVVVLSCEDDLSVHNSISISMISMSLV